MSANQVGVGLPPQSQHRLLALCHTGNLRQGEGSRHQVKLHLQGQKAGQPWEKVRINLVSNVCTELQLMTMVVVR